MARNTETLSTRDLASPSERAGGTRTPEDDMPDVAAAEGRAGVDDQAAPAADATRLPADEETQLPASEETAPPREVRTEASAGDQSGEPRRPSAGLDTESVAREPAVEDRPVKSTHAVSASDPDAQAERRSTGAAASAANGGGSLLPAAMDATFQERWKEIQTRFVDEPRGAVEDADGLVANLMQQLAEGFAKERERLEAQWGRGEDISTEDLRVALQRYRTFFQRLLST
jgi:hypothetical protein